MRLSKARIDRLELLAADRVDTPERKAIRAEAGLIAGDGMEFARWAYRQTAASELIVGPHHVAMQNTLQRVIDGEIKRLIINVPPGYTKTLFATQYMIARGLALNPKARFLHLSYSHSLALLNSSSARRIIKAKSFQDRWPMALRDDTDSKAMWWTNAGGGVYATSSGGQVTGFRAGHMEAGWNGCFPAGTEVMTEHGPRKIDEVVLSRERVRVLSFDVTTGKRELQPVIGWWENPANEIVEVGLSDGVTFRCTPDHKIYTLRGYVRADSLTESDMLPASFAHGLQGHDRYAKFGGNLSAGPGSVEKGLIANFTNPKTALDVGAPGESFRDGGPGLAHLDLSDDCLVDAVASGERSTAIVAGEDGDNLLPGELGAGAAFEQREGSVALGIRDVSRSRAPNQIHKAVVSRDSVDVTAFLARRPETDESLQHELVDTAPAHLAVHGEVDARVAVSVELWLENGAGEHVVGATGRADGPVQAADVTKVADLVEALVPSNRHPVFVRRVGHADKTYCLSVRFNSNFYLAKGQVLVHNCLLIDDPVKPDDAFSQVRREGVNDGFNETIKSRLAIEDTPLIVIMQRIHHNDLSGYLLRGGSGEKWHHLCLPVIIDNAAPYPLDYTHGVRIEHGLADGWLWPYKHNAKHLDALKAHRRTFEAQYMQAPRKFAADGALWTEAMLSQARELLVSDDTRSRCVVGVDPAVTSEATSDETGIVVASAHGRNRYSVDGDYSGRYTPQGWARKAMQAVKEHDADAIVAEVNQGGDMVESTLRACGFRGRVIKVRASKGKFARAEPISAMYAQGQVAHRNDLYSLESQMLEYVPSDSAKSPDRLDAMVWALTELAPAGKQAGIFV